ncbi:MAG: TlpA family protein disulfide reductase [Gemmatimonadaceae bacterium]
MDKHTATIRLPRVRKVYRRWPDVLLLIVLLVVAARWLRPDAQALLGGDLKAAWAAPDLRFATQAGDTFRLRDLEVQVVMLTYWASWCGTCRHEMPDIQALHAARSTRGLVTIGMAFDRDPARALAFGRSIGMTFPVVFDDSAGRLAFSVVSVPTTVLIDREGHVRHVFRGALTRATLQIAIDRLLGDIAHRADERAGRVAAD